MSQLDTSWLTQASKRVLSEAQQLAASRSHPTVTIAHVIVCALKDESRLARGLLEGVGVDTRKLENDITIVMGRFPSGSGTQGATKALVKCFHDARALSQRLGDSYGTMEHFFLAFTRCREPEFNQSTFRAPRGSFGAASWGAQEACDVLRRVVDFDTLMDAVEANREDVGAVTNEDAEKLGKALEESTRDLTAEARAGKLGPIIGREGELRRTIQILCRKTKSNPVFVGDPGVGKSSMPEALAIALAEGAVPEGLKGLSVLEVELDGIMSGAKMHGGLEERLGAVVKQAMKKDALLYFDELAAIVGMGGNSQGGGGILNFLKPYMVRGLKVAASCTHADWRKYVERDQQVARRFQDVEVAEPSPAETMVILRGIKEVYEEHHGVRIADAAIVEAVRLSGRYLSKRHQPDKAIDLLDESCALVRSTLDGTPAVVSQLAHDLRALEVELEALDDEPRASDRERMDALRREVAEAQEALRAARAAWEADKGRIAEQAERRSRILSLRRDIPVFERDGRKREKVPGMREELERLEAAYERALRERMDLGMLSDEVDVAAVSSVLADWTGIPASRMQAGEGARLLQMEGELREMVVGQDRALTLVSDAIRQSRSGLQEDGHPIGSFFFLGPTGVGKTETARALARFLFNDPDAVIRIDMSEFMQKHEVARLTGAPPGYIGYDEGGVLTNAVSSKPFSIVLFDEVEKAHPDCFNLFLQVLDAARLTDSSGRTTDFRNTVVIFTSNVGSGAIAEMAGEGWEALQKVAHNAMREKFRPEFINRIDDVVVFRPLEKEVMQGIARIQTSRVAALLAEQEIELRFTEEAIDAIAEWGFDPEYGARPLKRVVRRRIRNPLSAELLKGHIKPGAVVEARFGADAIDFVTVS